MTYNSRESAEWTLAVDAEAGKLLTGADKVLADGAARAIARLQLDVGADRAARRAAALRGMSRNHGRM